MKRRYWILLGIVISSMLLRLSLMTFIENPGLNDQTHYYNLATRLINGEGFTIDYVWHYSSLPEEIEHPIDHWMPAAGVVAAAGMLLFGENPQGALFLFVIAGSLLPIIVYIAAKQYNLSDSLALMAAAFAISLPDIVWNSLRSDTTILNMVLIPASILLFLVGIQKSKWWAYALAGMLGGLAYLTRNDSILILPLIVACGVVYAIWGQKFTQRQQLWQIVLVPVAFFLVASPWMIRNYQTIGTLGSPETEHMFFMVDAKDHYAYNMPLTLESMMERRTISEHINKRLFELVAAFKQLIISLDVVLPLLIIIGGLSIIWERNPQHWLLATPTILWILGILIAYPILLPLKSQSGSFEKAYLTIIPLMLPFAAIAIQRLFVDNIWRTLAVIITVVLMAANSFDVVRLETQRANAFFASIDLLTDELEDLDDVTGDTEIRVMTQDPYSMSYAGYSSVMIPLTSNREDVLFIAERYQIDYLIMPAARPAIDNLYQQREQDERFTYVTSISNSQRLLFEVYAFNVEGGIGDSD